MNGISNNNIGERYIPGVCNIGKSEIKRRKQAGWSGLIITVILLGLLVYFDVPRPWRLVIFIPVFNFSPEIGKTILSNYRCCRSYHILLSAAVATTGGEFMKMVNKKIKSKLLIHTEEQVYDYWQETHNLLQLF